MPKDENHLGAVRTELQGALASSLLGEYNWRQSAINFDPSTRSYDIGGLH